MPNRFDEYFGTSSPVWTFAHDSEELVLSTSGGSADPTVRVPLGAGQADEVRRLTGEAKVLLFTVPVFGRELQLHLLGRKINGSECAGVAALLSDAEAVAKNSMQALAFAEGIVSEVNAVVVVLDRIGTIHRFNHMAEEYTGHRESEVIGENAQALFMSPDEGRASRQNIAKFFDRGEPYDVERSIHTVSGPRRFLFRNKFVPSGGGVEADFVVCSGVEVATVDVPCGELAGGDLPQILTETYHFDVLKRIMDWAAMVDGARALLASVEEGSGDAASLAHARRIATSAVRDAYALYEEIDARLTKGNRLE